MGATVTALVAVIAELQTQIGRLETELADRFEQHPDAKIIRSLPGLGMTLGARVLGEFGDDPNRYADRQVSQELLRHVTHHPRLGQVTRRARPLRPQPPTRRRLLPVGLRHPHRQPRRPRVLRPTTEPPATPTTAPYEPSRNRLVGILHGCLRHHTLYDSVRTSDYVISYWTLARSSR